MLTLPNPYILLGSLVVAVCLFLSGFFYGKHVERGEQALNVVTVQNKTIDDANNAVAAEQQRALAAARAEEKAKSTFQIAKLKGERDAALKASTNCNRDSVSMGLLNAAIRSANGEETASDKLSISVPISK